MNIVIHRGTHQIGGCITEIHTKNTRIFVDLGSELPGKDENILTETLKISGVTTGAKRCDGVLFTHYHGDHIGMLARVLPDIPLYMGSVAKEIFHILQKRLRNGIPNIVETINTFEQGKKFFIGDIAITPFSVDHSAFDAYMFMIEAEDKKILHTGDFRGHGFRGKALINLLEKYVGQVDVLITEGTTLSRNETTKSEHEVQKEAKVLLEKYKYVFVITASTNIDRLAAFHEATPIGKYFICDEYQFDVLKTVRKLAGHYSSLYEFKKALSYGKNLKNKMETRGFCLPVRSGQFFQEIMNYYKDKHNDDTLVIYSMWGGYLKQPNNSFNSLLDGFNHVAALHTSGHATKQCVIDVCNTVRPKKAVIPIHCEGPTLFDSLGIPYHVEHLADGQIYVV